MGIHNRSLTDDRQQAKALGVTWSPTRRVYPPVLDPRQRSLLRGNVLVLCSLLIAVLLSDFPHNRATLLLVIPTLIAIVGTADTVRCIRKRWSFYHAGVLLCIYMDLMAVAMILFFLVYPYSHFLASSS